MTTGGAAARPSVVVWAHRLGDPLLATGVGRYAVDLVGALERRADLPVALALGSCGADPDPSWSALPVRRARGPRRLVQLAWAAGARLPVDAHLGHPDLVHVASPSFPVPVRAAALTGTIHDLLPFTDPRWYGRVEGLAFRRSVEDLARRATALVCVSRHVADQVAERLGVGADRLHVVHHGVPLAFAAGVAPGEAEAAARRHGLVPGGYVVAVGALSPRKGRRVLVEALVAAGADLDGLVLALAGPDRGEGRALVEAAAAAGVADRVRLLGFVPDADLPGLVAGAAALAHPTADEGFGLPPLEAMAVGTPAVATAAGAVPEVVAGAALLVPPGAGGEAWADALRVAVADGPRRADLVARGLVRAGELRWEAAAERTLAVWRGVLGR